MFVRRHEHVCHRSTFQPEKLMQKRQDVCLVSSLTFAACMAHCTQQPLFKPFSQSQDCCGGFEYVRLAEQPLLELSPSGDWGDILHYAIRGRLRRLALHPLFSFRTSLSSPRLSCSLAAPIFYWSHNLIKHVSLKMQFPAHQHMRLEHFVVAAPAVPLIKFATRSQGTHPLLFVPASLHCCRNHLKLPNTTWHKNRHCPPPNTQRNTPFYPHSTSADVPAVHLPTAPTLLTERALEVRWTVPHLQTHTYNAYKHTKRAHVNTQRCTHQSCVGLEDPTGRLMGDGYPCSEHWATKPKQQSYSKYLILFHI